MGKMILRSIGNVDEISSFVADFEKFLAEHDVEFLKLDMSYDSKTLMVNDVCLKLNA